MVYGIRMLISTKSKTPAFCPAAPATSYHTPSSNCKLRGSGIAIGSQKVERVWMFYRGVLQWIHIISEQWMKCDMICVLDEVAHI